MTDTSGPTSLCPLAHYAPAGSSSRTWQVMSLWGWTPYSATLPRWGMTRRGALYELPMPALPTAASGCSSLLPTPTATESGGARPVPLVRTHDGSDFGPRLKDLAVTLMSTPAARDWRNARPLNEVIVNLLMPTPTAMDSKASGGSSTANRTLTDAVVRTSLGARTDPRFADGSTSPAAEHPHQLSLDDTAGPD